MKFRVNWHLAHDGAFYEPGAVIDLPEHKVRTLIGGCLTPLEAEVPADSPPADAPPEAPVDADPTPEPEAAPAAKGKGKKGGG